MKEKIITLFKAHWLLGVSLLTLLILFLIGVYCLWAVGSFFIDALVKADARISASIIGAMITAFIGLAAVVITQKQIKQREIEEAHRESKIRIYKDFLKIVERLLQNNNEKSSLEKIGEEELINFLVGFKSDLILWGSPKVLKALSEFEATARNSGDTLGAVDTLYRAIREDIGLSNKGLPVLHLVKMYLSDPDELDKQAAKPS